VLTIAVYVLLAAAAAVAVVSLALLADVGGSARRLAARINWRLARRGEPLIRRPVSGVQVRVAAAAAGAGDLVAVGASLAAI
jgi:hypothetical protein